MTQPHTINASPTKEFFIEILTRDVQLSDAISELVDNSVDGAKRLRPEDDFTGLNIDVTFDENSFKIQDNCGGISVDIAEKYAFRFGRTGKMPDELKTKRPIGQFGVGMKRAIFKLGNLFTIQSVALDSSFVVEINVEDWKNDTEDNLDEGSQVSKEVEKVEETNEKVDDWIFPFKERKAEEHNDIENCGTTITVKELDDSVGRDFKRGNFLTNLVKRISRQQSESIEKGLSIKINGNELRSEKEQLIQTGEIRPLYIHQTRTVTDSSGSEDEVIIDIYAGVSAKSEIANAGWSIFCNGRLVLFADKSEVTGWGVEKELLEYIEDSADENNADLSKTPKAHYQFARFRGFVYFNSDNAELLPWNTSKTGINIEEPLYRSVRIEMIRALRQVIDFLNLVKKEKDQGEARYDDLLEKSQEVVIKQVDIPESKAFYYTPPTELTKQPPKTAKITFSKPYEEVERAKQLLDANSNKEVGEKTFEYFIANEDSDNG